jgi:hypothetical protein
MARLNERRAIVVAMDEEAIPFLIAAMGDGRHAKSRAVLP